MKKLISGILFGVITFLNITKAQPTFQKIYGGPFTDDVLFVNQTSDQGFIITGAPESLIKTDANGDTLWTTKFISPDAMAARQTLDGGFIIAGSENSSGPTDSMNASLIKTDASGNIQWVKSYDGTRQDYGIFALQTNDGGFILIGQTSSFGINILNPYLIKTDHLGDTLWTRIFQFYNHVFVRSIQQTTDGGFIVSGEIGGPGIGNTKFLLLKTDSNGTSEWIKTYKELSQPINSPYGVQQTSDGGYIICGRTGSFGIGTNEDPYVIKTDGNGTSQWSRVFAGSGTDRATSVFETDHHGFIIAGLSNSIGFGSYDIFLIKTDSTGHQIWSKTYGGSMAEFSEYAHQTTDGGYVIAGRTESFPAHQYDILLIKTDSSGITGCNMNNVSFLEVSNNTVDSIITPTIFAGGIITSLTHAVLDTGLRMTTFCSQVVIDEFTGKQNKISINPNPSTGNFNISIENFIDRVDVSIYNIYGEAIFTKQFLQDPNLEINLEMFSSGIYIVKLSDGKDFHYKKFLIEH